MFSAMGTIVVSPETPWMVLPSPCGVSVVSNGPYFVSGLTEGGLCGAVAVDTKRSGPTEEEPPLRLPEVPVRISVSGIGEGGRLSFDFGTFMVRNTGLFFFKWPSF